MKLVNCNYSQHAKQILELFNDAILNSTALYDYQARSLDSMLPWFKAKEAGNYPVLGLEDEFGQLLGFASYGQFRGWPAYKYTVEHSVYVAKAHRNKGVGRSLMTQLIVTAKTQNCHVLVGGIDVDNKSSIKLHESLGFTHSGTIKHAGFKFGRWLDLGFYQLILETPINPIDGA